MPLAIGFLAAVAALAPPLPPPPTSPTQVWGFGCSFIGLTGFILTCFVTLSPTWRVWGMSQCLSQDELLAPLLSTDPLLQVSSYSRVRTIYWLLALFLHSVNATLYLQKRLLLLENNFDCNGFFSECILPIVALIACTVYLVHLCWTSFPGKEVIFAGCTACIFYFSIAFTSLVYSNTTIAFEIVHILITIVVNILRFSSQDKIPECGWFCLTVAVAGTIIGFQWLPLRWCISVGDTKPKLHIAYKIAASVGGAFRFCDIVVISCPRARKNANKLLNILHECFY